MVEVVAMVEECAEDGVVEVVFDAAPELAAGGGVVLDVVVVVVVLVVVVVDVVFGDGVVVYPVALGVVVCPAECSGVGVEGCITMQSGFET